jgi:hypothetical protein
MRWPSYRLPTWLLVICVGAAIIGFMDGILTWIVNELNEVFARAGLAEPHPDAWTWIITSLLVGVAGLIPLTFHINYSLEHPDYTWPRCPYCAKPLPAGDEARELHRIQHALERIETVLTDLVSRVRA